jgi:hypothetical protein
MRTSCTASYDILLSPQISFADLISWLLPPQLDKVKPSAAEDVRVPSREFDAASGPGVAGSKATGDMIE